MKYYFDREYDLVLVLNDDMSICSPIYYFIKYQRAKGLAVNTLEAYSLDLKIYFEYLNHLGKRYSESDFEKDIHAFIMYLNAKTDDGGKVEIGARSPTTIDRIIGTVSEFHKFYEEISGVKNPIPRTKGSRGSRPASLLEHTGSGGAQTRRVNAKRRAKPHMLISEEDADALEAELGGASTKYGLILRIMRYSGARIQEVLDLEIPQIPSPDVSKSIAVIDQIKSKGRRRDLFVPMFIIEEINDYIINNRSYIDTEETALFLNESRNGYGRKLSYGGVRNKLNEACNKLGIKHTCHEFRHLYCTDLMKWVPPPVVKEIMGHRSISTTMTYTHIDREYIAQALADYWVKWEKDGFA